MKKAAILMAIFCGLPAAAPGAAPDAAALVRRGIAHYRAGDYRAAARAFHSADVARPDDPRVAFDLATAYAAEGDLDKAAKVFEQAALSREPSLAAGSHYNLGTLAAEKARAAFGDAPQDATPEVRRQGLGLLAQAVAHYRDCLGVDENHADARHNLETIRLWIKQMQAVWREHDRQKQREEMGLLEFLAMIDARQRGLRLASKALAHEADSPKLRQELSTSETSQRSLAEEIEPLKEKIRQALQPQPKQPPAAAGTSPPPAAAGTAPPPAGADEAVKLLGKLADDAGAAMGKAADRLGQRQPADAVGPQTDAVDKLDQVYLGVVPFAQLVQRAISTEQGLIDEVAPAVENADENASENANAQEKIDLGEPAWNQGLLARWAQILPAKANKELESLKTAGAAGPGGSPGGGPAQQSPLPEAAQKQLEGLKQSMEKAVALGPKVHELAAGAAADLDAQKPQQALPKEREALKLLKQIADSLPKQKKPQQGDSRQKQQNNGQKEQQQQADQNKQQQSQSRPPRNLSQQQAEAVLRKVRERQHQRRELEKQLQQYVARPRSVEKDW